MKNRKLKTSVVLWMVLGVLIASSILFSALIKSRQEEENEKVADEKPALVRVQNARVRTIRDMVTVPGRIEPYLDVNLATETGGRVLKLNTQKGARVEIDQVVLKLDDSLWRAIRKKAAVEMKDAERDLVRFTELQKTGAVSASEFDAVQLRLDMAKANLTEADVQLDRCVVRSPLSGIVNSQMIEIGEYANEGQVVLEILDIDQVKVAMEVPERDIAALSSVEEMSFTVAALSDRTFTGKVHFVSAKASRSSNSFMVELCLDNPEMTLRPGMIASVSLPRAVMENVVVLPLSAIIAKDGEYVIFVAESDRAARRIVKIASILEREAVIATGLKSGELVVMEGQRSLTDGCLLKIVPADN